MATEIVVTVVAGILLAVAVFGTVYPILPGSPIALVVLIGWGWTLNSAASWSAAGVGALLACIGWSASALLVGRKMKKQQIPRRSIMVGVLAGIVGMFVIPVAGLFLGFAGGLFLSEYVRHEHRFAPLPSGAGKIAQASLHSAICRPRTPLRRLPAKSYQSRPKRYIFVTHL